MTNDGCTCVICADSELVPTDGPRARMAGTVREHGWSVVLAGGGIGYAYTIGLWHTFRRPEVVMFGLDGQDMHAWLNAYVEFAGLKGWPADEEPFGGVMDGFETLVQPVHGSWHPALFGAATDFYRDATVAVQQLVWPDRHGRWHWAEDATPSSRNRQPYAWKPVAENPAGGWRLVGELCPGFPFGAGPDEFALTSRAVLDGDRPVRQVFHHEGAYDVLDERGYDADDLCLAFLGELTGAYPAIEACADLPDDRVATLGEDGGWTREEVSRRDRRTSKRAWTAAVPR